MSSWLLCCDKTDCGITNRSNLLLLPLNSSCLEHLLDNGADPSMVNSKGYSAVHYAAYHGNKQNLELVRKLCSFSASSVEFPQFQAIALHFSQILHFVLK